MLGHKHLSRGGRKLPRARPVGCDEGESFCQHLWETCQPVLLPPFPLLDSYRLCFSFLLLISFVLGLWRGMY